jgi:UDP-galactopyranose mutase
VVKTLVVGAGFSGATIARCLHDAGDDVVVVDRREHVGGTAYDFVDEWGVRVSSHGAHLFHTNAAHVVQFLSRFTRWTPHEHRVLAQIGRPGMPLRVPMPVNRTTVNMLFGLALETDEEVEGFFAAEAEPLPAEGKENAETQVTTVIGRRLFDLLYRDYTLKQWGRPACELSSYVTGRLPFRVNDDDRYFTDTFQAQPCDGWAPLFEEMLHGIEVTLGTDALLIDFEKQTNFDRVVYTGPIDEFFDHVLGPLPWRSVRFEHANLPGRALALPVGVVNYCGKEPYTRRIEWRHLTGQDHDSTTVTTEFPEATGDPHYPIPCRESWDLLRRYKALAARAFPNVIFAGRLGSYRYMTMDQTVAQAMKVARLLQDTKTPVLR